MSHLKERTEKICLNCNAELHGRYCHVCGQENIEPKDKFWHLVTHFVYDIIHFDGKFFNTARYLLFRPGFLSLEYMRGRRADFLHPIRMYVFVSAFFFLMFFSFFKSEDEESFNFTNTEQHQQKNENAQDIINDLKDQRTGLEEAKKVSVVPAKAIRKIDAKIAVLDSDLALMQADTANKTKLRSYKKDNEEEFTTIEAYDSAQLKHPERRDGWLERLIMKRQIKLRGKYHTDESLNEHMREKFWHSIPQLLFTSLPLVALLLELLYIRRTKQFFYVSHIIYVLHLYCALFILLFITFLLKSLAHTPWLHWLNWLQLVVWLYMVYYLFRSMKVFYGQGTGKTIVKMLLLGFSTLIMISILFVFFIVVFVFLM